MQKNPAQTCAGSKSGNSFSGDFRAVQAADAFFFKEGHPLVGGPDVGDNQIDVPEV